MCSNVGGFSDNIHFDDDGLNCEFVLFALNEIETGNQKFNSI